MPIPYLKLLLVLVLLGVAMVIWTRPAASARLQHLLEKAAAAPAKSGPDRVAQARINREALLKERFRQAGVPYPPREIFLRAFKHEKTLELWAREASTDPFRLIAGYPILVSSGVPGPKLREGDSQVPEGFYIIDRFNPHSTYHLSLGINYPNARDRTRADPQAPGRDIFIHGKAASIGCLPLGDPAIEELYVCALDTTQRNPSPIAVDIFPARMAGPAWNEFAAQHTAKNPALTQFWAELQPGYDLFEADKSKTQKRP